MPVGIFPVGAWLAAARPHINAQSRTFRAPLTLDGQQAERDAKIVDFYLYLAASLVTIRQLIQRAREHDR